MDYERFKKVFNEIIFEKSKADLIEKIALNPTRYIGLFRPTKPKAKILQNLLQSHEIRFGDAFECVMEEYFKIKGCQILTKTYTTKDGQVLNLDQCFRKEENIYFIEQKVRDDHDSTKKRGQIQNFEKKLGVLLEHYSEQKLSGIFYFVDPDLVKNKKYYAVELAKMTSDYKVETQLFYGKPLFTYLGYDDIWEEILNYLKTWKEEIPDFPEINFDLNYQHTFDEIKDLPPLVFRKLFNNDEIYREIIQTLFPQKTTLFLLLDHFKKKSGSIYATLSINLENKLNS